MTAPRFGAQISGQTGWSLASATFANPQYIGPPVPNSLLSDSLGFDISPGAGVLIYFSGTYTGQTVTHEQTLDPNGATGWFSVYGQIASNSPTTPSASFSTTGQCYVFPAYGVRHRITVTALSTGTMLVSAALAPDLTALNASGGGGGGGGSAATATANNPTYAEGATNQPLSVTLFGAQRTVVLDSAGVPLDYTVPAPVVGSVASGSAVGSTAPVMMGARAATTNPTAVTDGQVVREMTDVKGRLVIMPHQVRELISDTTITITASTAAADLIAAGGAGVFNDILSITLVNTSGNGSVVQILNADGTTVRWTGYAPPTDMRGIVLTVVLKGAAANAKWTAKTVTSVSSVTITVQYAINT